MGNRVLAAVGIAIVVWLVYFTIDAAQKLNIWPFS